MQPQLQLSTPPEETVTVGDLVRRARAGEVAAFEELYRRHVGRVHGLCLRLTGDVSLAEDLTQATFLRAWQRLDGFRHGGPFAAWLLRIATNAVYQDRRSWNRKWGRLATGDDPVLQAEPRARELRPDHRLDLERAMGELPRGARDVLVLHDVEGHRHDEIAELLGVSVGTSKSQLHRARHLMRKALPS